VCVLMTGLEKIAGDPLEENRLVASDDSSSTLNCRRRDGYSTLMSAVLMTGYHFSISALCNATSASGVWRSRG
jgi:hypothetical protein